MKKYLPIIIAVILIVVVLKIGLSVFGKSKNQEDGAISTPAPIGKSLNTLAENLRPKVEIRSRADNKALIVTFSNLKNFSSLQYELSYLTKDEIPQGVISSPIKLNGEESIEKELLLGTCSGTVTLKCRYDEEVHQISLSIKYVDQNGEVYDQIVEYNL